MIPAMGLALALAAQPTAETEALARELFEAADRAYEASNYPVAVIALEQAYELAPRAAMAFSLAQACRMQFLADGDVRKLQRAIEMYRTYVEQEPEGRRVAHANRYIQTLQPILDRARRRGTGLPDRDGPATQFVLSSPVEGVVAEIDGQQFDGLPEVVDVEPGPHRIRFQAPGHFPRDLQAIAVEGRVLPVTATLEPMPARVTVLAPDGARVYVDGTPAGTTPLPEPLALDVGHHRLDVQRADRVGFTSELDLGRDERVTVTARMRTRPGRVTAYALFGAAGALAVGAGVAGAVAAGHDATASDLLAQQRSDGLTEAELSEYEQARSARDDAVGAAVGLGIGAGVAGLSGLLLYWIDRPRPPRPAVEFRAAPIQGGAVAGVATHF